MSNRHCISMTTSFEFQEPKTKLLTEVSTHTSSCLRSFRCFCRSAFFFSICSSCFFIRHSCRVASSRSRACSHNRISLKCADPSLSDVSFKIQGFNREFVPTLLEKQPLLLWILLWEFDCIWPWELKWGQVMMMDDEHSKWSLFVSGMMSLLACAATLKPILYTILVLITHVCHLN